MRGIRKAVNFLIFWTIVSIAVLSAIGRTYESSYREYLWLIPAIILAFLTFKILKFALFRSTRYLNKQGYVVLRKTKELEHRAIAVEIMERDLYVNEVVHHINGRRDDNRVSNLCLMDREKHEHFHSWLRWKKEKSGYYPRFKDQIRILRNEYGGTPLTDIPPPARRENFGPVIESPSDDEVPWDSVWNPWRKRVVPAIKDTEFSDELPSPKKQSFADTEKKPQSKIIPRAVANESLSLTPELKKNLFVLLRDERKKMAEERSLKAYHIFHDKTLLEMSDKLPDSKHAMLEIGDVTPEKYETYGAQFISVIRKFKEDLEIEKRTKDRA